METERCANLRPPEETYSRGAGGETARSSFTPASATRLGSPFWISILRINCPADGSG
jgi:hypothetical protein